jgi:hypothetical protein
MQNIDADALEYILLCNNQQTFYRLVETTKEYKL